MDVPTAPAQPTVTNTLSFYIDDFPRTLFPLNTNRFIIENGEKEIQDFIKKCLDEAEVAFSFLPQRRVYAAKPGQHLRRTAKFDPVAEYYVYDLIYRNRSLFRKPHSKGRTHYGYRFEHGSPITPTSAFKAFKSAIAEYSKTYSHSMSFDVASYFNGIYHHDMVSWFAELNAPADDVEGLGQFLRQINSGRSLDCLPQGLFPTKMMGNDFLRFIDNYHELRSEQLVRFMDDIYLFSNEEAAIEDDFQVIQRLLGEKGLSINPQKTTRNTLRPIEMESSIDSVKKKLLDRRRLMIAEGYDDAGKEIMKETVIKFALSAEELDYIDNILKEPEIEEEDVELILTTMRDHVDMVENKLPYIITKYPHLSKSIYSFCANISDKEQLSEMVLHAAKSRDRMMEFQLFWFCVMLEEYLMNTSNTSALISVLFNHRSATPITKAKILEIRDNRFGLPDLRNDFLKSGQSDWLAWSSAVGSVALKPASRNHVIKYFGNNSQMNHLLATIVLKM